VSAGTAFSGLLKKLCAKHLSHFCLFPGSPINTPVCDFALDVNGQDWMYCESGSPYGYDSYKRKINKGV